ncbi:hypothetical protein BASA81_007404 [Batrachochytrium salamandrivorans]|nr:hypothetical protein BASA81_007404 [Batrachochytrium salamandrivorans]
MQATREGVRSWLLLIALLGLGVSLFWGYLFEEKSPSSSCPFASLSSTALAEAIDRLPNLPAATNGMGASHTKAQCATCIVFNSLTFDVGNEVKQLLPRDQQAFTVEQMAKLLGNPSSNPSPSSPHVQQAITKLLQQKFTYWPSSLS